MWLPRQLQIFFNVTSIACLYSNGKEFKCSQCEADIVVSKCFRDRAVTMELKKATIQCTSSDCPWKGKSGEFKVNNISVQLQRMQKFPANY